MRRVRVRAARWRCAVRSKQTRRRSGGFVADGTLIAAFESANFAASVEAVDAAGTPRLVHVFFTRVTRDGGA